MLSVNEKCGQDWIRFSEWIGEGSTQVAGDEELRTGTPRGNKVGKFVILLGRFSVALQNVLDCLACVCCGGEEGVWTSSVQSTHVPVIIIISSTFPSSESPLAHILSLACLLTRSRYSGTGSCAPKIQVESPE